MELEDQKKAYEEAIGKKKALFDVNPIIFKGPKIVLVKRIANVQEGGKWSLPGSKMFDGERIEEALKRIAKLKTGLDIKLTYPRLLGNLVGIYDDPKRDPREHVVGLTFLCSTIGGVLRTGGNSFDIGEFTMEEIEEMDLAFDHKQNIMDVLEMR